MRPGIVLSPEDDPVWTPETVSRLPPLESLRFFEAAARHESFARAASELGVTAAAVAYHVRALEEHLDAPLFERRQRGVHLNPLRARAHFRAARWAGIPRLRARRSGGGWGADPRSPSQSDIPSPRSHCPFPLLR